MATKAKIAGVTLCVIVIMFPKVAAAQYEVRASKPALHSVYAELFGPYYFFTANYDRILSARWGMRVGFGFSGLDGTDGVVLPLTAHYFFNLSPNHKLEMDFGVLYENSVGPRKLISTDHHDFQPLLWLGYRYRPVQRGFMFRAGLNADRLCRELFDTTDDARYDSEISLSFGYAY